MRTESITRSARKDRPMSRDAFSILHENGREKMRQIGNND